ncbi:MAG: hypothetical protein QOI63_1319 [Thermoplasmata archaeon]|jgi:hypothetical protein|nr:hypothetical protein [Thermoplasmata archaeon]
MDVLDALEELGRDQGAQAWREGRTLLVEWTVARRRSGGGLRHLRYRLQVEVDEPDRTVLMAETLWERTSGHAVDLGADFRTKDESYRIGTVWERSAWEAQAGLLKAAYDVVFDFAQLRHRLEKACSKRGYRLRQLIPI